MIVKKLVVFYSLEGPYEGACQCHSKGTEADILELKPKEEIPKKGFMRYVKGGGQVVRKIEPEIHPLELDPQEYDVLFIGTPVWAGSYASPLRSFFSIAGLQGKRVALLPVTGEERERYSSTSGKAWREMKCLVRRSLSKKKAWSKISRKLKAGSRAL